MGSSSDMVADGADAGQHADERATKTPMKHRHQIRGLQAVRTART